MQFIKRNIIKVVIIVLLLLCISAISLKYYLNKKEKENIEEEKIEITTKQEKKEKTEKENKKMVNVDIKGAIKNPGVYEVEENSKIIDLVKLSGGLTDEADTTYINLAKKVRDEMVIIIYTRNQIKDAKQKETLSTTNINNSCICPKITNDACITKENTTISSETNKSKSETKTTTDTNTNESTNIININTATKEELQTLKGIGEGKAEAIIKYREENGNFTKSEDIMNVNGIGESVYEKIKDNITI